MNSDWAGLESVLFKIFPGAQVATTLKNCNNNKILHNHLSLLTTLVILPCCLQVLESFSDRRTYSVEQVSFQTKFFYLFLFCGAGGSPVSCLSLPTFGAVQV